MINKYYSLAAKKEGKWVIEYGSFWREDVREAWAEEKQYYLDNDMKLPKMQMLITNCSQNAVMKALNKLNKG
tara:strand:- start:319 stop:534 length:216 start_codon:yes stop_codon:yes gene_type:complete